MGRVRELGSADDVVEISRRLGWVRPVLDFAHMHATSDGAFTSVEPFAEALAKVDAVLEPGAPFHIHFSRHPVREPQRDEAPARTARGRCAPSRSRRRSRGFERPATVISESPDEASSQAIRAILGGVGSTGCDSGCSTRRPTASRPSSPRAVRAFCEPIDVDPRRVRRADRADATTSTSRASSSRSRSSSPSPSRRRRRATASCASSPTASTRRCRRRSRRAAATSSSRAGSTPGGRRRSRSSPAERARRRSIGHVLDPAVFKAYDVRGLYPSRARRGGRVRDRARVRRAVRAAADRGRARHAALVAVDGRARVIEGAADAGADVVDLGMVGTEMVYFAVGELGLDGGDHGHRLAQPEGVHRDEDRAPRRAAGRRASRGCSTSATARCAREWREATRGDGRAGGHLGRGSSTRVLSFVDVEAIAPLRVVIDAANGMAGRDAAARARAAAAGRRGALLLRARRLVPEPRAEPAPAGEPRVHRARDAARPAPTSGSPTTGTPTAASSSTTRASSCPATSRPRSSPSRSSRRSRAAR